MQKEKIKNVENSTNTLWNKNKKELTGLENNIKKLQLDIQKDRFCSSTTNDIRVYYGEYD